MTRNEQSDRASSPAAVGAPSRSGVPLPDPGSPPVSAPHRRPPKERPGASSPALAAELCLAEERERRRLAKELHDQALQTLAAARIDLQILGQLLSGAEAQQQHQRTLDLMTQTERELCSLSADLSPQLLYDDGLGAALKWLAERCAKRYGVPVDVTIRGTFRDMPSTTSVPLFHAARELLANAGRHAKASRITVRLTTGRGKVVLTVEDDGLGFRVSAIEQEGQGAAAFGLLGLRARLRLAGGDLDTQSQPGRGTVVAVTLPRGDEAQA